MNPSAQSCDLEEAAETEAPFACLDPECSSFFNELDLSRRHTKREHWNRRRPRHKYVRANITTIEIPEEMSSFTEPQILTENVHERSSGDLRGAADWRRTAWKEAQAAQEERNLTKRRANKAATCWRRRSKRRHGGCGRDGPGDPGAAEVLQTTRVTGEGPESATYCTLFLPKENDIVKDMQVAGRVYSDLVTKRERGTLSIWFCVSMLKAAEKILMNRKEKGELSLQLSGAIKRTRSSCLECMDKSMQTPSYGMHGHPLRSRISLPSKESCPADWRKNRS